MNKVLKSRLKNRSLGLCRYCPTPAAENRSVCLTHLEKRRVYEHQTYPSRKAAKKALGLCLFCLEPGFAGENAEILLCPKHRAKLKGWSLAYYYHHRTLTGPSSCLQYPYIGSDNEHADGLDLLLTIHRAVPMTLPESIRAEVCQDLAVAVLEGTVELSRLGIAIPGFLRAVQRRFPTKFGPRSLDQFAFGEGGRLLRELI